MTPIDFFLRAAALTPDATAVIELNPAGQAIHTLTFGELAANVQALASAFQHLSGKPCPTVALLCGNSVDMLTALLATYACRGVLAPLTPKNPAAELRQQIDAAQPDLIVADAASGELARSTGVPVVSLDTTGETHSLRALLRTYQGQSPQVVEADLAQTVALKFTGGSSGRPKAVLQSVRCLNTMVASLMLVYAFNEKERFLMVPPMTHGAGTFVLPVLAAGGCLVVMDAPRADALLDAMATEQITSTWVPPTLLYQMIDKQAQQARPLPRLRNLLYGGAGAATERLLQARTLFGDVVGVTYGLTEAPVILAGMPGHACADDRNLGTAGRAGPLTRLAVMDASGGLLPARGEGEIVARGDLLMTGYMDMPEETASTLPGGWLRTGDVGYIDERGYLFIKGRTKDVIISGGFNVYPVDVEATLATHPAVAESVVFGMPDAHWGERVEAVVELKAGATANAAELITHARNGVGPVRAPKTVHIVDSLPRNALGKVQKRQLRQELIEKLR